MLTETAPSTAAAPLTAARAPETEPDAQAPMPHDEKAIEQFAHRAVQITLDHLARRETLPAVARPSWAELAAHLMVGSIPRQPTDLAVLLDHLESTYFTANALTSAPSYHAFVPSPSNPLAPWLALLANVFNAWPAAWVAAPGATTIECELIDWLRELIGMPEGAGGLLTSGGSEANLTALRVARHATLDDRPDPASVAYCSDQAHSSIARAQQILGFADHQLRTVACDDRQRMDPDALRAMVEEDLAAGRRPYLVVATAGTTSTGAVDPLPQIAATCREFELWFHVDAAFGAGARIGNDPLEKARVEGIQQADSLIVDPHKALLQPFGVGAVLVREGERLPAAFSMAPAYLQDAAGEINLYDYGIHLARPDRALGVWASMRALGFDAVADAIDHGYLLARVVEQHLRSSGCWSVISPAQLGIVCFQYDAGAGLDMDAIQRRIVQLMLDDGSAMVLSTVVGDRTCLRMMTNHPQATPDGVRATIDLLAHFGAQAAREAGQP